jgi:hypothetical protein
VATRRAVQRRAARLQSSNDDTCSVRVLVEQQQLPEQVPPGEPYSTVRR